MINLLPTELQTSYRYARRNARLLHWVSLCGLGFAGLLLISLAGLVYMQQTTKNYSQQITTTTASLQMQKQGQTEKQAQDISNSVRLAVQVLSKQVLFSDLLRQLATITPSNTTLANININQVQGALDITANTASYDAATQLQVNLADSKNKLFTKADIVSISCASASENGQTKRYPCAVSIRALFAAKNPFLFINTGKAQP